MRTRALVVCLLMIAGSALAQENERRLDKPRNDFFYPQANMSWGYDSAEPGDGWGWADTGARTQLALELFSKDESTMQRGYSRLFRPVAWDFKFSIELDPEEQVEGDSRARFRPLAAFVQFGTRWDRTSLTLGHRPVFYGHNPRLDPGFDFLPNMSGLDLSFGSDNGVFFQTPVSKSMDLELSATAGMGDTLEYHGGWLATTRLGTPTFRRSEVGAFVVAGSIPKTSGAVVTDESLTDLYRLGVDWVHKAGERWKVVNQASVGESRPEGKDWSRLAYLLDSVDWYVHPRFTAGLAHTLRREDGVTSDRTQGRLFVTFSYAPVRDVRVRLNPYVEYYDSGGNDDEGVILQVCWNCGLIK